MSTVHVFRKTCLVFLGRIALVCMNSASYKYFDSSGLDFCARMLFTVVYDCCVPRGNYHIPVFFSGAFYFLFSIIMD